MSDGGVQVLNRTLDLVELLAVSPDGLSIAEMAEKTQLPKSTIHRILSTLTSRHYVEKDAETSIYKLGYIYVELASLYLNKLVLKTEAAPFMHEAANAFGGTAHLGILENNEVTYLESVEQFNSLRMYTKIGKREPLYCTALGKVLTAFQDTESAEKIASGLDYKAYTDNSISSSSRFIAALKLVRAKGYALDINEHTPDSSCLAVPVYDYTGAVMAAMSISAPRLLEKYDEGYIYSVMLDLSLRLSGRMGYVKHAGARKARGPFGAGAIIES